MPHERTIHRYGDYPALFWDLRPDEAVDGTNPAIIARLLEHAPPDTIRALVPADVLLRDFDRLDLPEHTRRFWSIVVRMMRERRGLPAPDVPPGERGITYRPRPRFHPDSDPPLPIPEQAAYRYGDVPELFWDLPPDEPVDGTDPAIIARLLEDGPTQLIRAVVPRDVLLREFDALHLQDHTRRFWALVIEEMKRHPLSTRSQTAA